MPNRSLKTLEVNLNTAEELMSRMPENRIISESGIKRVNDIKFLLRAGQRVLVGAALMKAVNPNKSSRRW